MATSPDAVRGQLAVVTGAVAAELSAATADVPPEGRVGAVLATLPLVVPPYYDAAGSLASLWYEELREESRPARAYVPTTIGDPATDWIEREIARFQRDIEADLELEVQRILDETVRLAEKEVARGFRDSILGNTRIDTEAIGWSRIARPGACKFCAMLADKGAVYRSESTAIFSAHTDCNCAARPEFRGGDHGPEASVIQYEASARRARDPQVQEARNARVRAYLNENYPDLPG